MEESNLKLLEHFTYLSTWFGMVWCLLNIGECEIAGNEISISGSVSEGNSLANRQ